MSKRISFLIIAGLLSITVGILSVPVTYAATGDIQPDLEDQMVTLVNQARVSNGLNPLTVHDGVRTIARSRSADMAIRNYFSHTIPPDNYNVRDMLERAGINFYQAGENLEWNNDYRSTTAKFAFDDIMNSPPHRANMLDKIYTYIGIGVAEGRILNGRPKWYFTQVFINLPPPSYTINGYVIKTDTGDCFFETAPYPNVNVNLSDRQETHQTSQGGYYEFSRLTAGTRTLSLTNFVGKVVAISTRINGNWAPYTSNTYSFSVPPDEHITFCIDTSAP